MINANKNCEFSYDCTNCDNCRFCDNCENCEESVELHNCKHCYNCSFMINSHHCYNSNCDDASYMWCDEQLTPDEWEARWKALQNSATNNNYAIK